jgi:thymidylate synthase (FAD)
MEATLIESMGTDALVVNSARVSFSKDASNYTEEQNGKLIAYLAKHNHFTPFTHPHIVIREKVPLFVARQRFKHTVGFTYNEVSRRYVDDAPTFHVPTKWRFRPASSIKQGSSDVTVTHIGSMPINTLYEEALDKCQQVYGWMIRNGVAPEQARMVLPQSMYTEYYVTGSLAAWARAYRLRIDTHAQKEIQELAVKWDEIIRPLFPISWEALVGNS